MTPRGSFRFGFFGFVGFSTASSTASAMGRSFLFLFVLREELRHGEPERVADGPDGADADIEPPALGAGDAHRVNARRLAHLRQRHPPGLPRPLQRLHRSPLVAYSL